MVDICNGLENVVVCFENGQEKRTTSEFQYIRSNIPGPGCNMEDFETYIEGCKCKDKVCDNMCKCVLPYGRAFNERTEILPTFLTESKTPPIFECNRLCICTSECRNRVTQKGFRFPFAVFATENKGKCLRTLARIPRYNFVCEYAGEVISREEARRRTSVETEDKMNYIIVLREHFNNEEMATFVDPTYFGNIGRFISHSCIPNLAMVPVRVHTKVPKLCLFSLRNIDAGEELTFSYSGLPVCSADEVVDSSEGKLQFQKKPCHCQSENCAGYLPFDFCLF